MVNLRRSYDIVSHADRYGNLEFSPDEIFSGSQLSEDLLLQFIQWNVIGKQVLATASATADA
jgi:hypothetical protein